MMKFLTKKSKELYDEIDSLVRDIEFEYNGVHCAICPFSRTNIAINYGKNSKDCTSIEQAMTTSIFKGRNLNEIAEELVYL